MLAGRDKVALRVQAGFARPRLLGMSGMFGKLGWWYRADFDAHSCPEVGKLNLNAALYAAGPGAVELGGGWVVRGSFTDCIYVVVSSEPASCTVHTREGPQKKRSKRSMAIRHIAGTRGI